MQTEDVGEGPYGCRGVEMDWLGLALGCSSGLWMKDNERLTAAE